MDDLLKHLKELKHSTVHSCVQQRIQEFKHIDTHSPDELIKELSFCILTANFNAQRTIQIHTKLCDSFQTSSKQTLAKNLKACGYRFPTTRATYIVDATKHKHTLQRIIHTLDRDDRRDWLVQNINGLGYKEASHFLRNIGYDDYAIIDSHILDLLERYHIQSRPKTLTKKKYLDLESLLRTIANQADLSLAELDLYLWYMETGTILK
jgi:N-glycosylase/DNA lyase